MRLILGKDLRVEWRSRLRLQSLLLFGAVLATVTAYALRDPASINEALPVGIWLLAVFIQVLFLAQAYHGETENGCFEALRLAPVPRASVALAKTLMGVLVAGAATVLALAVLAVLTRSLLPLSAGVLVPLGIESVGIVAAGSLVFATSAAGEKPALDLHALVLVIVAPLIFFGHDLMRASFGGAPLEALLPGLEALAVYAALLVTGAALAYAAFSSDRATVDRSAGS